MTGHYQRRQLSVKKSMLFNGNYDNGEIKRPMNLVWTSTQTGPMSIRTQQLLATRVQKPVTLAPIPKSKILTDEDLK